MLIKLFGVISIYSTEHLDIQHWKSVCTLKNSWTFIVIATTKMSSRYAIKLGVQLQHHKAASKKLLSGDACIHKKIVKHVINILLC